MARLGAQQHANRRRAVGKRRGDGFETDLGHFIDCDRQHVRRQAVAEARERIDQRHAMCLVVHEHDGRLYAPGITICRDQRRSLRISASAAAARPAAAPVGHTAAHCPQPAQI